MKSISTRLTLWYALAVTLTASVFLLAGRFLIVDSYIEGIDQLNDKEFEEIRTRMDHHLEQGDKPSALEAVRIHSELDAALFFFQVGRSHESPVFTSANLGQYSLPESVHRQVRSTVVHPELGRLRVGEYEFGGYDINIASSLKGLEGLFANMNRVGAGSLMVVFVLSLGLGRLLTRLALRPVAEMQKTATRISANNLSERIELFDTGDELNQLGKLLNTMFDRLERSFQEIQKFTADASHELKTPLSLIRLSAEKISDQIQSSDGETEQLLAGQLEMIDRLNKVVDDLLLLAKTDTGSLKLARRRVDVHDLLEDFSQDAQILCENAGLIYELSNGCDGHVLADHVWLNHVLFNLISNAIKFTPRGGYIRLSSESSGSDWHLSLQDDGPGIPEEKLGLVFRRFYNEPSPDGEKGCGLGLALCQGIIRLHEGRIWVSNRTNASGLLVQIRLPLMKNE